MKAAIIGLGPQGVRVVKVVRTLPGIEVAAVVDTRREALDQPEIAAGTARFATPAALWEAGGADLVCIVTNGPSHADLAVQAMAAGARRVMVEKPMACSVADCQRMADEARRRGVRLAVNQSRRHDPLYRWLRERIRSGAWGQPRLVSIQRPGIGLGCLATHSFDLARFLTGRDVRRVSAWVDPPLGRNPRGAEFIDPGGLVVLDLGAGVRAVVAQLEDGAGPMSVELDLTAARVRLDEKSGAVEIIERDLSVPPGPNRPPRYAPAEPPAGLSARTDMAVMLRGLLEDLLGDGPLECDAAHGQAAVEVLVAAHASDRLGHVPVDPADLPPEERARCLPVT